MRKIVRGMCMLTVVALAFTSCKKNEESASSFNGTPQVFNVDNGERAYIDNGTNQMYFEEGDQVMLFNIDNDGQTSESALYHAESTGTLVRFIADGQMTTTAFDNFYAFYPGANVVPDLGNSNYAKFPIAGIQVYREDAQGKPIIAKDHLYMAAKADTKDLTKTTFTFKNICGVLVMPLYSSANVTKYVQSIEIEDKFYHLVGDVNLKVDGVDDGKLQGFFNNYNPQNPEFISYVQDDLGYYVSGKTSKTMVLDCTGVVNDNEPNGVKLSATPAAAKAFCIVLRPLALSQGFTMRVNYVDANGQSDTFTISTNRNNMIKPNFYRTFSAVDIH